MTATRIAVIGGTGFEELVGNSKELHVKTPYGVATQLFLKKIGKKEILVLPRHGMDHSIPPHKINYRANILALYQSGVKRILATNAVGAIDARLKPGDAVIPHDFIDFTKHRLASYYDESPVTHIDVSEPYCPQLRRLLAKSSRKLGLLVCNRGVMVCTEGPRYETVAEVRMFRHLGCSVVGMTGFPEVVLARELEMCYATICFVSNMAAGMQKRLTALELSATSQQILPKIEQVLFETIKALPLKHEGECPCDNALQNARFQ